MKNKIRNVCIMEHYLRFEEKNFNSSTRDMPMFHRHDYYEIYYLFSGKVRYLIDDNLFDISTGDIVLINKNKLHMTKKPDTLYGENIKIYINDNTIDSLGTNSEKFKDCFNFIHINVPNSKKKHIEEIFKKIRKEYKNKDIFSSQYVTNLVYEILTNIYRMIFIDNEDSFIDSFNTQSNEINIAIRYVYNNYSEKLTLSEVAKIVNMNPSYFSRCFKKNTGIGLMDYVNNIRIKNAVSLISDTNMSLTEIAHACGYSNQSYFCRQFQKIIGCSASKYKKDKTLTM